MSEAKSTPGPVPYQDMAPRAPDGPVDLNALVPGAGPLELDVGFGRGMSLFARAEAAPEVRLLGIEIKAKWATKVEERRVRLGLHRVKAVCADARELLSRSGPDGCLSRVYVHFPDPWWKKRHGKRRVLGEAFVDELARLLAPGGEVFVQTDVPDRADDYRLLFEEHPAFSLAEGGGVLDHNPFGAISNREKRAEEDGLPVYRILARRV